MFHAKLLVVTSHVRPGFVAAYREHRASETRTFRTHDKPYLLEQDRLQPRVKFLFYVLEKNGSAVANPILESSEEGLFRQLDHLELR